MSHRNPGLNNPGCAGGCCKCHISSCAGCIGGSIPCQITATLPALAESGYYTWGACASVAGKYTLNYDPFGEEIHCCDTTGIGACVWSGVFAIPGGKGTLSINVSMSFLLPSNNYKNIQRLLCVACFHPLGISPSKHSGSARWGLESEGDMVGYYNCSIVDNATLPILDISTTGIIQTCPENQSPLCFTALGHSTGVLIQSV